MHGLRRSIAHTMSRRGLPYTFARGVASLRSLRGPPVATNVYDTYIDAVGNTPLIKLQSASERTGCNIYAKCEFMSIGGSIKDRAGAWLVADGEERGILTPGKPGILIEATAGNTGIGLTLAANARGYKTIIVIPNTQTQEKKDILRNCGAHLIEVPAFPFADPRNYCHVATRLTKLLQEHSQLPVFHGDQWNNLANRRAHIETTGPEILAQLKTRGLTPNAFSCAMGTGGTLTGVSEYLRAHVPGFFSGLTDPCGFVPYTYYTTGELKAGQGGSITEGIGQARITGNMVGYKPDGAWEVHDRDALEELTRLTAEEGLQVGLSSGINVSGAISVARHLGPGHTVVTVLCDSAARYSSKMYNAAFLRGKGLPVPPWVAEAMPSAGVNWMIGAETTTAPPAASPGANGRTGAVAPGGSVRSGGGASSREGAGLLGAGAEMRSAGCSSSDGAVAQAVVSDASGELAATKITTKKGGGSAVAQLMGVDLDALLAETLKGTEMSG